MPHGALPPSTSLAPAPVDAAEPQLTQAATELVVELGAALHRAGASAYRLEDSVAVVARALAVEAVCNSTPTALTISFGRHDTAVLRLQPGAVDLGRLSTLNDLVNDLVEGRADIAEGLRRIRALETAPPRFGVAMMLGAGALVSFAVARSFGGGLPEMGLAAGLGLLVGWLSLVLNRRERAARALELLAAFMATAIASGIAVVLEVSPSILILASLIVLFPGYSLTTAVAELATRNSVSGTARMMSASMVLLQLAVGAALADKLAVAVLGPIPEWVPAPLPAVTEWIAPLLAGAGLAVLFQVPWRALPSVLVACVLSFAGARLGSELVGPELGVGLGAFLVTSFANVTSKLSGRPAVVSLVPALLLLVPGSVGYRSMMSLVHQETMMGVATGVSMLLIAASIVAGMTVANALVSPRRTL